MIRYCSYQTGALISVINRFKTVNDKMDNVTRELESIYIKKANRKKIK